MSTTENKEILRGIFEAMAEGQSDALTAGLADDASWTIKGSTPFSRTYTGKDVILSKLLGPLMSRLEGGIRLAASRFIAEGDLVVVEAQGQAITKAGVPYNNNYCFVMRLEGGKIREITEYIDTQLVMQVFAS